MLGVEGWASKAGVEGLTRGYAAGPVKGGVIVNVVSPWLIETGMAGSGVAASAVRIPLGWFGAPEASAQAVLMIIGNGYLSRQTTRLNGGGDELHLTARRRSVDALLTFSGR